MNLPILYSYRRCPYAMRARMALKLANIAVEIREISLRDKPHHMLQVSPKATLPVLVLLDGTVIDESLVIMQWCFEQATLEQVILGQATYKHEGNHDVARLTHSSASLQANIHAGCRALILTNDIEFKRNVDGYKYPERGLQHETTPDLQIDYSRLKLKAQLKYRVQGEVFLAELEILLQKNRYLFADSPSLADIAIFPFIRQFAAVDCPWFEQSEYPKLRVWLNEWVNSSLFQSVMTKNPTFIG